MYCTPIDISNAPGINSIPTFFSALSTSERVEVDYDKDMQIAEQPDMRFATQFLMFITAHDIKGYSYGSFPSLVAYKLSLFIGHFLIGDLTYIIGRSQHASFYTNDQNLITQLLKTCAVPEYVKTVINYVAPVKDTQRRNLRFTPSFTGFSFYYAFGYAIPSHVFLNKHNILATNRTNTDPSLILAKIYNSI
jgi:hypothetical protein